MAAKLPSATIIVLQVVIFGDALNYGCLVISRKTLDQRESCMRYKFMCKKRGTRAEFSREISMPLSYI